MIKMKRYPLVLLAVLTYAGPGMAQQDQAGRKLFASHCASCHGAPQKASAPKTTSHPFYSTPRELVTPTLAWPGAAAYPNGVDTQALWCFSLNLS
jgi:mono/diheme cytochrome c family protein